MLNWGWQRPSQRLKINYYGPKKQRRFSFNFEPQLGLGTRINLKKKHKEYGKSYMGTTDNRFIILFRERFSDKAQVLLVFELEKKI